MELGTWGAELEARLYDDFTSGFSLEVWEGLDAAGCPLAVCELGSDEEGARAGEFAVCSVCVGLLFVVWSLAEVVIPFRHVER